jgi:hypothetical protein
MPSPTKTTTFTNWSALEKAGLAPTEILCQGYHPLHPGDMSCHTRILLNAEAIRRHAVDLDHGGGFTLRLRRTEKPVKIWQDLAASGLEVHDFRCDVCDAQVPLHPQHILKHLKNHVGKFRRTAEGGAFHMTVATTPPVQDEEDLSAV